MTRKIEDIFNNCLERMFKGESVEDCLGAYPEQAPELEPLLKTSFAIAQRSSAIQPTPEFKGRVHSQLQAMLYAKQKEIEERGARIHFWHKRWVLAMTGVLGFLLIGVGTVGASTSALPDGTLYPLKLATEQVRLTLALSDVDKAKLHIQCAERRADEMVEMAYQGKSDKVLMLTEQVDNHLDKVHVVEETLGPREKGPKSPAPIPAPAPSVGVEAFGEGKEAGELKAALSQSRAKNLNALRNALDKAPERLKPILQQAIENIEQDYNKTISIVGSGSNQ
jgi:hypothetical protein